MFDDLFKDSPDIKPLPVAPPEPTIIAGLEFTFAGLFRNLRFNKRRKKK